MEKLIFDAKELERVVDHSLAAPAQGRKLVDFVGLEAIYKIPERASVILVKDQGLYLMSNGEPGDPLDGKGEGKYWRRHVVYAEGCHPEKDSDWYETARALVGGDDFGETLPWALEIKAYIEQGFKKIVVNFSEDTLYLSAR